MRKLADISGQRATFSPHVIALAQMGEAAGRLR